ncbi:MAG: segregation/condensation protein A [Myxococcaceae bacterium]|nr:segregation/condensation protein A [Myxococcaceae bacterium]MBH2006626.1 segregation/condensation protein A [Myxococcaceae bacterium]
MALNLASIQLGDDRCRIEARGPFKNLDAKDYSPNPESDELRVSVPNFEGPLDLLLHLIKKHSMDIFDISISVITQKYLEEIENLELDLAGEFLLMAATLLQIKSRMLLPDEETSTEEEEALVDPRADLVRRLLEYQRFKGIAEQLGKRDTLGYSVFGRVYEEPSLEAQEERLLAPVNSYELIENFAKILEALQPKTGHTVSFESISLRARLSEMIDFSRIKLQFLFQDALRYFQIKTRLDVIVTFLAILEMARLKLVEIKQEPGAEAIHLKVLDVEFESDLGEWNV